jgi:hypothetical protein
MCANPSVFIEVCNPFSSESHRKACAFFVLHGRSQTQMKLVTWMSNRNEGPICARIAAAQPLPSATRSSEDCVGCARTVCLSDGPHQPQLCLFSSRWVVSGLLDQYRGPPSLAWRSMLMFHALPRSQCNAPLLSSSHFLDAALPRCTFYPPFYPPFNVCPSWRDTETACRTNAMPSIRDIHSRIHSRYSSSCPCRRNTTESVGSALLSAGF